LPCRVDRAELQPYPRPDRDFRRGVYFFLLLIFFSCVDRAPPPPHPTPPGDLRRGFMRQLLLRLPSFSTSRRGLKRCKFSSHAASFLLAVGATAGSRPRLLLRPQYVAPAKLRWEILMDGGRVVGGGNASRREEGGAGGGREEEGDGEEEMLIIQRSAIVAAMGTSRGPLRPLLPSPRASTLHLAALPPTPLFPAKHTRGCTSPPSPLPLPRFRCGGRIHEHCSRCLIQLSSLLAATRPQGRSPTD